MPYQRLDEAIDPNPSCESTRQPNDTESKGTQILKVFIVDDSALVRDSLTGLIAELEAVELVGQAENAHQAITAIRHKKPDVVILDIRIPGGNGLKVLEVIKQDVAAPVVIMFTSFPYPQYRRRCLEAGAEYFFDKSTEFHQVTELLRRWQKEGINGTAVTAGSQI